MEYRNEITDNPTLDEPRWRPLKQISWAGVFAGAFVALAVAATLGFLGVAIGASSVNPWESGQLTGLAIGTAIWWIVSGIIAFFAGGWVAAALSGHSRRANGVFHGLVSWSLVSVFMLIIGASAMGAVVGGGISLLQSGAQAAGPALGAVIPGMGKSASAGQSGNSKSVTEKLGAAFQNGNIDMAALGPIISRTASSGQLSSSDRQQLSSMLSRSGNMSQRQADSTVNAVASTLPQTMASIAEETKQAADTARKATAAIAWALFITLILEAVAACIGGAVGSRYWPKSTYATNEKDVHTRAAA